MTRACIIQWGFKGILKARELIYCGSYSIFVHRQKKAQALVSVFLFQVQDKNLAFISRQI